MTYDLSYEVSISEGCFSLTTDREVEFNLKQ
ncbi:hypothetical protein JOC94_004262 [Bacillus thermophilus]|uniref:Uncharacterized protein n=1 Tax=Siminovitchia thermophila TaxID=1245522 RepID=A0ABS2RC51_9BACI|nr:hypothetical protein [Siminovitchia thermophila]